MLLNYAYGDPQSNLLIVPTLGSVNLINHGSTEKANVRIQWSESTLSDNGLLEKNINQAMYEEYTNVLIDYVALRDLEEGEELYLDYGKEWEDAWNKHINEWKPPPESANYMSAADFSRSSSSTDIPLFRTVKEQKDNPYPKNIMTACLYEAQHGHVEYERNSTEFYYRKDDNEGCLRPCTLLARSQSQGSFLYVAQVENITNKLAPKECQLPMDETNNKVYNLPEESVFLVDKGYSSDEHLINAFRHEIGVPNDMYPDQWKNKIQKDPMPFGDFQQPSGLEPGELSHIRWSSNNEVVSSNAYLLGTPPKLREELLSYANRIGITERFENLVLRGNELLADDEDYIQLNGMNWYLQRPSTHWNSNMHWISPADEDSQNDYLRALSIAGFDEILSKIGEYFGFRGLACYHLTFIAVSRCSQGYMHYDLTGTADADDESRAFNIIIPLILSNETGPELDLRSDNEERVGRYRYQYDIATMVSNSV
jgi:hypothetical protein